MPQTDETSGVALQPCPFCGSRDVEQRETISDAMVVCNNCGSRTGFVCLGASEASNAAKLREQREVWNTRTAHAPQAQSVEAAEKAARLSCERDGERLHPVLREIMAEVEKATRKFPTWPTRIIDAGNVVSEEAGELAKACLQVTYEPHKETMDGVRIEAIQTAAMAFRFLCSLDRYDVTPGDQHEQAPLTHLKGSQ